MSYMNNSSKTLYHYCDLTTFLSIIKNSSLWLSDVQKSNDYREMVWYREKYYEFITEKYLNTKDENIINMCSNIFILAAEDDDSFIFPFQAPIMKTRKIKKIVSDLLSMRTYAFCLTELSDSLGQWRGYANDGKGIAIGFSRDYLRAICNKESVPYQHDFFFDKVSYKKEFNTLFDKMFNTYDLSNEEDSIMRFLIDLTRGSAMYKHPSFKEEKEWRIIYSMDDFGITKDELNFDKFSFECSEIYLENFCKPTIDYIAKDNDIIPHIEVKIKNLNKAIDRIVIGPKCALTENDIRHILLKDNIIRTFNDKSIKICRSDSSYK